MSAITILIFRTCHILYLIWKRTWTKILDAPSFTMRISEGSQNHYTFCKYYFLNLFEARQTNLINKMCFLLRIFNYGIICPNNKIFLDAPLITRNILSLSLSPNVCHSTAQLRSPACLTARPQLQPGLAPPRPLPLVGLPPGLPQPARQPEVRRSLRPGVARPAPAESPPAHRRDRERRGGGEERQGEAIGSPGWAWYRTKPN